MGLSMFILIFGLAPEAGVIWTGSTAASQAVLIMIIDCWQGFKQKVQGPLTHIWPASRLHSATAGLVVL